MDTDTKICKEIFYSKIVVYDFFWDNERCIRTLTCYMILTHRSRKLENEIRRIKMNNFGKLFD